MHVSTKSPNLEINETRKINLISPAIKNSSSRGARFLDLVKQNKLNVSPQLSKRLSVNKNVMKSLMEKNDSKKEDDYLKFSNQLPNLNSSPSSSILSKRKAADQESNVAPDSSPMGNSAKRKRVSFNDPVSTTKEYLITEDEERHKSSNLNLIRCLVYTDDNNENGETEENKENIKVEDDKIEIKIENDMKPFTIKEETSDICSAEDHDYYDKDENPQNTDITTSSIEENNEQLSAEEEEEELEKINGGEKLIFKNKSELMNYITKNISVAELIENITKSHKEESVKREEFVGKILHSITLNEMLCELVPIPESKHSSMTSEQVENTSNIINHISKMMKVNDRIKHKVLDALSEKHSKDFLTHALQENSVSQVCEKLTVPNIVNYLIHKVNICDDNDEIPFEVNRMNKIIMHQLIKRTSTNHEIITDQKETQELLKLLFQNKQKIDVLDQVHEFLRSNIIHGQL
ncbi:hypothetical protein PVAND_007623 [Polypedilum vanderplanki]|uniref:Uncharacterized protein n=1 Tax=Polypedilum vanderplanki TaxID=319348 RepID=A0A9J6C7X4_POLVA|nr:hypothetical protein PVAND_007623 [Polypedilum vanderplanki]